MNIDDVAALTAAGIVLASSLLAAGIVFHPELRVATGSSMEPTIQGPAVVHCDDDYQDIEEGDIVAVTPGSDRLDMASGRSSGMVMHRVTFIDRDVSPANIKTRGDNEESSDGYSDIEDVECVHRSHVSLGL